MNTGDRNRFLTELDTRAIGDRLWALKSPQSYVDRNGRLWVVPKGFVCDKRSGFWLTWMYAPPSIGQADRAWIQHDFERQCWALLGLRPDVIDSERFYHQIRAVGKSQRRARWHCRAVTLQRIVRGAGDGDGVHRDDDRNAPVYDETLRQWIPLLVWVRRHYRSDGHGI